MFISILYYRVGARKPDMRKHNTEFMHAIDEMDQQDDGLLDDTDEGGIANKIVASMTKKENNNHYVTKRKVDSMGIKFETNKRFNGVKGISFQENQNYPMIDVRSGVTRKRHEIWDVWWADCFDLIKEGKEEEHLKSCRPFIRKTAGDSEDNPIDDLPYVNEKIFKVSKAITQHLSDVLKTNQGIFDETVEIRFLRNLRQKADDMEK